MVIEETFASRPSWFTSRSVPMSIVPSVTSPSRNRFRTTSTTSTAFPIAMPRAFTVTGSGPLFSSATTWKT
jgi:hypothetical protein